MNILFTCVGRRNYLIEFFRQCTEYQPRIIGADMDSTSAGIKECDVAYNVPSVISPDYIPALLKICERESIDLLVSLNDLDLPVIAANKSLFEAAGVVVLVSDPTIVDLCFDKLKCFEWLVKNNIYTPATYTSLDVVRVKIDSDELSFPLIVKPRWGSGSVSVYTVYSLGELATVLEFVHYQLDRCKLLAADQQNAGGNVLIQQHMIGTEHGVDVLNDLTGKPRQVVVKEKLAMRSGETDKACIRKSQSIEALGYQLGELLGHVGNLDCDIFTHADDLYVLELNPRFGGGYPFSHSAGADYPSAILAWVANKEFGPTSALKYDAIYSKADRLIEIDGDKAIQVPWLDQLRANTTS